MSRSCVAPNTSEPEAIDDTVLEEQETLVQIVEFFNNTTKKRKHLSQDAQVFCFRLVERLMTLDGIGREAAIKKTAALTKVSQTKIRCLLKRGVEQRKRRKDFGTSRKLTPSVERIIREEIYASYCGNTIPTVAVLLKQMKQRGIEIKKSTLHAWVQKLGFKFQEEVIQLLQGQINIMKDYYCRMASLKEQHKQESEEA